METYNTVFIRGEAAEVFRLAAELEQWTTILPHYWKMEVTEKSVTHKIAEFGAWRDFDWGGWRFPCKWTARQELFAEENRITFKHTRGITKGMWVEWRIVPEGEGVNVTIYHELNYSVPILGAWFAEHIVGKLFVSPIANRTLATFKQRIEGKQ